MTKFEKIAVVIGFILIVASLIFDVFTIPGRTVLFAITGVYFLAFLVYFGILNRGFRI